MKVQVCVFDLYLYVTKCLGFSNKMEVIAIKSLMLCINKNRIFLCYCVDMFHVLMYVVQILNITCVQSSTLLISLGLSVPTALVMSASVSKVI